MLVCPNCFSDTELIGFIHSSGKKGNCDVCGSKGIDTLDLSELTDFFQELLGNFQKIETGTPLRSKIQEHWSFFSSHKNAVKILNAVVQSIDLDFQNANDLVEYSEDIISIALLE